VGSGPLWVLSVPELHIDMMEEFQGSRGAMADLEVG
jgi:hypothetical protein